MTADVGPTAKNATLLEHMKGRRTEVDAINGLIVDESWCLGLATPVSVVLIDINQRITGY